ncbi:MAG: Methyltransferase subunit MtxX, phosphotransacetylase family enzyme [Candidatus Methanohalarchaeum thermophilum]|uniref:Methyltransferase subunit MtxX, phosphotransacetylase family enzyme n=1 Tax=Methanohalarchaeum thermophilum TaxID=1903181 RepID=A0A1Q6DVM2_METT1|nr:MAG: Methyltransferase subunit MtxX, phosphotransacetylase family enzyme [Candidatus Methanohalarchaeum thermophilum]
MTYSNTDFDKIKLAIGASKESNKLERVVQSVESVKRSEEVLIVGKSLRDKEIGLNTLEVNKPEKTLVQLLKEEKIDGAIRGNLSAKKSLNNLKNYFNLNKIYRVALLETKYPEEKKFFLAPIGIDEGRNIGEKEKLVRLSLPLLKKLSLDKKVGILSSGRKEDTGRSNYIDRDLKESVELENRLKRIQDISTRNYNILIEKAIEESDFIVPPNGVIGNFIFRTLVFLGGGEAIGAPIVNLDKIFVDTSRSQETYHGSVLLAFKLVRE